MLLTTVCGRISIRCALEKSRYSTGQFLVAKYGVCALQDFNDTAAYRTLQAKLAEILRMYWWDKVRPCRHLPLDS